MGVAAANGVKIREGDVVLVNFGWNRHLADDGPGVQWWSSNAPGFTEGLCRELHDLGVRAVGSDDPTCDMAWGARAAQWRAGARTAPTSARKASKTRVSSAEDAREGPHPAGQPPFGDAVCAAQRRKREADEAAQRRKRGTDEPR